MAKAKESREATQPSQQNEERMGIRRRESLAPTSPFGPFSLMNHFVDEMERVFGDFGFGHGRLAPFGRRELWSPQIEVFERGGQFIVRADLPGLTKDDVNVDIADDALTIQGERRQEREEDREGYYHSERSYGSFYRSIPLPEGVNADQAKANFRDGMLEITMPASHREQRRRQIEIQSGGETGTK
ncbi:MAG: Hsp20/alpha crystallin family protein [Blastocatellales bacterium]